MKIPVPCIGENQEGSHTASLSVGTTNLLSRLQYMFFLEKK